VKQNIVDLIFILTLATILILGLVVLKDINSIDYLNTIKGG